MTRLCVVLIVLFGCGPAAPDSNTPDDLGLDWNDVEEPAPSTTHHGNAIATLGIRGPEKPWEEMSRDERELYMIGHVLPIYQELFHERDPEFGCASCHGSNMRARNFAMPSTERMIIHPPGTPENEQMRANFGELVQFMGETVTPTMATLLGRPLRSAENPDGFGCWGCHPSPE